MDKGIIFICKNSKDSGPNKVINAILHLFHENKIATQLLVPNQISILSKLFNAEKVQVYNGIGSVLGTRYGLLGLLISVWTSKKTFLYWHELEWSYQSAIKRHPIRGYIFSKLIRKHNTIKHLVTSTIAQDFLQTIGISNSNVIHNCVVDPGRIKTNEQQKNISSTKVLAIASIQKRKGTDLFYEAADILLQKGYHVEFTWCGAPAGDKESQDLLKSITDNIAKNNHQNQIHFPGFVDPVPYLKEADIFLLTSRDDPFPLSVLEAIAMEKTVVTFDNGGAKEAIGSTGKVVKNMSAKAMALVIEQLLNSKSVNLHCPEARRIYLSNFTPEKFYKKLMDSIF